MLSLPPGWHTQQSSMKIAISDLLMVASFSSWGASRGTDVHANPLPGKGVENSCKESGGAWMQGVSLRKPCRATLQSTTGAAPPRRVEGRLCDGGRQRRAGRAGPDH